MGNARLFQLAGRLTSEDGPILAGEYELSPAMNAARILGFLRSGRVKLHYVLIPEGFTLAQIAARLGECGHGLRTAERAAPGHAYPAFASRAWGWPAQPGGLPLPGHLPLPPPPGGPRGACPPWCERFDQACGAGLAPAAKAAGMSRGARSP